MKNPVLITGATGTVGREVVRSLAERGTRVKALVHDIHNADAINLPGVELVQGDLRDASDVRDAMVEVDKIYLLTPVMTDIVEVTKIVVEEAEKAGVRKLIKHSIINADANRPIEIARLHLCSEKVVEKSAMGFTFIRPNQFMQNFINFYGKGIKDEGRIVKPAGQGRTSFIDARDIGMAAATVLDGNWFDHRTFTLTGPEALSNTEVASELSRALGREIVYQDVPEDDMRMGMVQAGMGEWMTQGMMEIMKAEKESWNSAVTNDFHLLTGKRPIPFSQFVKENIAAFK